MDIDLVNVDPVITDPDLYRVVFENDPVHVLEYRDERGAKRHAQRHPDSVMGTLTAFRRRVSSGGREVEVDIPAAQARWVGAQEHSGENIGDTVTHSFFVELKEPAPAGVAGDAPLGPSAS